MSKNFNEVFGHRFGAKARNTQTIDGPVDSFSFQAPDETVEIIRFWESMSAIANQFVNTNFTLRDAEGNVVGESKERISMCVSADGNVLPPIDQTGQPVFLPGAAPADGGEFIGDFPLKAGEVYTLEVTRANGGEGEQHVTYERLANKADWYVPTNTTAPAGPATPPAGDDGGLPDELFINGVRYVRG